MESHGDEDAIRAEVEPGMRERLGEFERGVARFGELTPVGPFQGRHNLTDEEREVAVALNLALELVARRVQAAAKRDDAAWQGLAQAERILQNELSRRDLPWLAPAFLEYRKHLQERDLPD